MHTPTDTPPDFIGDEPMLTAREVAQMLGLCRQQVHKMAKRGDLPCYEFGRARRFLRSEVLEAIQRFKAPGKAPRRMSRQEAQAYRAPVKK